MQRFLSTNNYQWSRIHLQRWKRKLRFVQCWNTSKMSKMSYHEMLTGTLFLAAGLKLAQASFSPALADCEVAPSGREIAATDCELAPANLEHGPSGCKLNIACCGLPPADCIWNQTVVNLFLGWHESKLCSKTKGRAFARAIRTTGPKDSKKISYHSKDSKWFGLFETESWTTMERSSWSAL